MSASGGDALTIKLRGAAPTALAFTDRPALEAQAVETPDLASGFAANAPGYADGLAPPNAALSFAFEGAAVLLPVELLNVTGAAPDYTFTARALGEAGVLVAVEGGRPAISALASPPPPYSLHRPSVPLLSHSLRSTTVSSFVYRGFERRRRGGARGMGRGGERGTGARRGEGGTTEGGRGRPSGMEVRVVAGRRA